MVHYLADVGLLQQVVTLRNSNYIFGYPFPGSLLCITYHKSNYFINETYEIEQ